MSAITFKLEAFEGPLDLLLHLISKHKLNIYDIEIALLLEQYLEYIDSIEEQDFDAAGDFLAMAARLVYIKTCSLLPQAEEAEEMKRELQGELIEYSVCKEAAARMRLMSVYGEVFVRPPEKLPVNKVFTGNIPPERLVMVYMSMTSKARRMRPVRAEQFSPIVAARIVTVTSKIVYVLKKLYKSGRCTVEELYNNVTDRSARVATFLAVLELAKSGRIYLNDDNTLITFNRETPRRHEKSVKADTEDSAEELPETEPAAGPQESEIIAKTEMTPESCEQDSSAEAEEISESQERESPAESVQIPTPQSSEELGFFLYDDYPDRTKTEIVSPARAAAKYALEAMGAAHSLAVPVFLELQMGSAKPVDDHVTEHTFDDTDRALTAKKPHDVSAHNDIHISEPESGKVRTAVKLNRFSARWRWRYPAQSSNCWSYRRERL